ncbi:FecR family protein [Kordiimonas gwangyangensis]|uniref:FecR family protein n=1 Tax=Kordiimonas gwangyangensis TaxID=288022 RepID=UPI0009DA8432|nr:FecR domain-containing protein [Kordiimonas gwangyangensis]
MSTDNRAETRRAILQQEAREWFVRLQDDDVQVEEIAAWQAWLTADPAHQEIYDEVEALWLAVADADLEELLVDGEAVNVDDYDASMSVSDWLEERNTAQSSGSATVVELPRAKVPLRWMAVAATLLVAVGVTTLFSGQGSEPAGHSAELIASISTARAEQRTAKLFDGSQIELGGASKVAVDFTGPNRLVRLTQGEAYFDVAPNPDQPFVVETPYGNVTAVGTAFNIRLVKDRFVVTVTEGKIDVDPVRETAEPQKIRVEAGSALALDDRTDAAQDSVKPAVPVSWRDGWLTYRSEPLEYVVEDINRYSEVRIELIGSNLKGLSYSGSMDLASVEDWVSALPVIFPVQIDHRDGGLIRILPAS